MNKGSKNIVAWVGAVLISACATQEKVRPPAELLVSDSPVARTDPDVLYYVGAAEISGRREMHQQAAVFYARAAEISDDPKIAERAVQVAVYADNEELTLVGIERWLALDPGALEPHRLAAIIYLRREQPEPAWIHIERILRANGGPEAWAAVIKMLGGTKDRKMSAGLLEKITSNLTPPESEEIYQQLSDLAVRSGRLELAEKFATKAIAVNPNSARSYNWRGRLRTSLNKLEDARADFARASELDPNDSQLRQSYAALLAELGDYQEAIRQLSAIEPTVPVLYSQGIYAAAAEDQDLAEAFYGELQSLAVEDENEKNFFLGQLGETLDRPVDEIVGWYNNVRSGDRLDEAKLRTALVLGKNDEMAQARVILRKLQNGNERTATRAFLAEAGLLREKERKEDAFSVYSRALMTLPENTDLLFARALLAEEIDRVDVTEKDLRKVLEQRPEDANALNALGYTLADRTDRYEEALDLVERAYAQLPEEPAVVDSMGWVQYKLGNLEKALNYLEQALELDFDPEIVAHLGEVLWVMGRHEDALETWNRGLEENPESEIIIITRDRFLSQ